jgi:hypothetical protein
MSGAVELHRGELVGGPLERRGPSHASASIALGRRLTATLRIGCGNSARDTSAHSIFAVPKLRAVRFVARGLQRVAHASGIIFGLVSPPPFCRAVHRSIAFYHPWRNRCSSV